MISKTRLWSWKFSIVLLTGTPIINYPNEVGKLFDILRRYTKTWPFYIDVNTSNKMNKDAILDIFDIENFNSYDYVAYSGNRLIITRNPYGFIYKEQRIRPPLGKRTGEKKRNKNRNTLTKRKTRRNTPSTSSKETEYILLPIHNIQVTSKLRVGTSFLVGMVLFFLIIQVFF